MKTLTTDALKELKSQKNNVPIINVLPEEAYKEEHIPDTENIPLESEDFVEQVENKVPSKDSPVVVYCASVSCDASPNAAKKLESRGFTNVYDFEGGTEAWKQAKLPTASGN